MTRTVVSAAALVFLAACASIPAPGSLVPPTADQDPRLPQIDITVAGRKRAIHIETFGAPGNPVLLVLHGSISDYRGLRGFRVLADRYRVVMWDQRGNGLSERITAEEYTVDSVVEEIDTIKAIYSPDRPVTLLGHSFGAMYSTLYMSRRPDNVAQAVLIEPGGLNGAIMQETVRQVINIDLFDPGLNAAFWQSEVLSPADHETMDYKEMLVLTNGRLTNYHCDPDHPSPYPVWRPGAYVESLRYRLMMPEPGRFEYNFAAGLASFPHRVLLVGSECSALGYDFQQKYHAPLFADVEVVRIENAGHRVITERFDRLLEVVRDYLDAY